MTHAFTDTNGRDWHVVVNVNTIKAIKNRLGLDLLEDVANVLQKLATDFILLVDSLYICCESQCKERHVSDSEFGELLVGDSIETASQALLEALVDFFPQRQRTVYRKILETAKTAQARLDKKTADQLENLDVETIIQMLEKQAGDGKPSMS